MLHKVHSSLTGGHAGVNPTYMRLSTNFFWEEMRKYLKDFVSCCLVFQKTKYSTEETYKLLQPIEIPSNVWRT